jgi:LuxR family transcriptional regulator, quorum-sensing system regulator BjaR1
VHNQFTSLDRDLEHLVFDTIEHAHRVASAEELSVLFDPACRKLGFDHLGSYSVRDPTGQAVGRYFAGSADPLWSDHYLQQDYFRHDAIVRLLPNTLDAIVWRDLSARKSVSLEAREIFDDARAFGLDDGYVLPQHYLDGGIAATILTAPQPIESNARTRAATHILAAYFAMGVRRLAAPLTRAPSVTLSNRQRECLQWVRAGKSNWEIGEILGLSEHTIAEHIGAARRKLGVRTKTQAVIEAIARGLISL